MTEKQPIIRESDMKNICTIDIEAPITKVFDFINDENKHKLWLDGLEETIREPGYDSKHPVGSKFQQKIRDGKKVEVYDGEVTAYERPQSSGCEGLQQGVFGPYRLSAHESEEAHAPRVHDSRSRSTTLRSRCLPGLSGPMMRTVLEKQLKALKRLIEADA